MKIILLQDIKNLGKKNDVKEVADGYARNFLLSRGVAKIADEKSIKELENKKAADEKKEKEIKKFLEDAARELIEREFVFGLSVGKKGEAYGSITKDEIKERLCDKIFGLKKYEKGLEIILEKPLKTIGEQIVEINFGKGVRGKAKIKIEPLSS